MNELDEFGRRRLRLDIATATERREVAPPPRPIAWGDVKPGERITSYIGLSADGTWTISATSKDTGADSTLHVVGSSISYDYATLRAFAL